MKLTVHPSAGSFLQASQVELEAQEAVNGLILGLALRLRDDPAMADTKAYLATVEDENGLALAALMAGLNVILYSPRAQASEALQLVALNLASSNQTTPGVTGPAALAEEFAACWSNITGQPSHVKTNLRIYVLRQVIPPLQPGGAFRMARAKERSLLVDWSIAFQSEALGHPDSSTALRSVELALAQNRMFVWEDEGRPVSMAASSRPTAHGMTVNQVYTPPDLRGKGYASACVAALSEHILDSGKQYCTLFTNLANPISNSIYQKIGYQPVCDFKEISFER